MPPKGLTLTLVAFLGLACPQTGGAKAHPRLPRSDLVAVLNKNPANPLGGEIWLMNLDGKLVRRLTRNKYHEEHPRFSPDGSMIVFVRNMGRALPGGSLDPKRNEIFVYHLRTGAETRLTRNRVQDDQPEWSFDGRHILFSSSRGRSDDRTTIWIMASSGSRARQITHLLPGDISHTHPAWAPDGTWLAFVNHLEKDGVRFSRIEKVRRDGTQRTVISSGGKFLTPAAPHSDTPLGDLYPNFSPDGAMVWSARRLRGGRLHLFSYGAGAYYAGKAEIDMNRRADPAALEDAPQFSPDGRRIVCTRLFSSRRGQRRHVVLTDPQLSFQRHITSRLDWDVWDPSWYPFADSGAERDAASRTVSYLATRPLFFRDLSRAPDQGASRVRGSWPSEMLRLVASRVGVPRGQRDGVTGAELEWKLEGPISGVISLAISFEGRLQGNSPAKRSLLFQLMDWQEKRWVTVLFYPNFSNGTVKIFHEMAPSHFIHPKGRSVLLRAVALGVSPGQEQDLATHYLRLMVRRD